MKTAILILAATSQLATAQTWVYLHAGSVPTNLPGNVMVVNMTPAKPRTLYGQTIPPQTGWHSPSVAELRRKYGDELFQQPILPCLVNTKYATSSTNVSDIAVTMQECKAAGWAAFPQDDETIKQAIRDLRLQIATNIAEVSALTHTNFPAGTQRETIRLMQKEMKDANQAMQDIRKILGALYKEE